MACPPANYFHTVLTTVVLLIHTFQPCKYFLPLLFFLSHWKYSPKLPLWLPIYCQQWLPHSPLCLLSLSFPSPAPLSPSYSFSTSYSPSSKKALVHPPPPPAQFTRGALRDQLCSERGFSGILRATEARKRLTGAATGPVWKPEWLV